MAVAAGLLSFLRIGGTVSSTPRVTSQTPSLDMSGFSSERPGVGLRLLFIHHSCGGQLLAPAGPEQGDQCIYRSHPNGGGLRGLLERDGYEVHEASYGSRVGDKTSLFDWYPKFRDQMRDILSCDRQDETYSDGRKNAIVVFKSCFTESWFKEEGSSPGNPSGPVLSLWNAKATLRAILPELQKHPEVLFVYVTAPPLAPKLSPIPAWKWLAQRVLGKGATPANVERAGYLARELNDWVRDPNGWLAGYPLKNLVAFDYYDVLTGGRLSNLSAYASGDGDDSHPSSAGNEQAARAFVPFLNRAVRRAALVPSL
jgi:hypothetical protein